MVTNNSATHGWKEIGERKLVHAEHGTYFKVIDFPVGGSHLTGECLWVEHVSGTEYIGVGRVSCKPRHSMEVAFGDLIEFSGGTEEHPPHFVKKSTPAKGLKKVASA
jgi:hypothetical protein